MEMHQEMMKEVRLDYQRCGAQCAFEELNLLAGSQLGLDYLVGTYRAIAGIKSRQPGAFEATSLMKP